MAKLTEMEEKRQWTAEEQGERSWRIPGGEEILAGNSPKRGITHFQKESNGTVRGEVCNTGSQNLPWQYEKQTRSYRIYNLDVEEEIAGLSKSTPKTEKMAPKFEKNLWEGLDTMKRPNLRIMGIPEGEASHQGIDHLFHERSCKKTFQT